MTTVLIVVGSIVLLVWVLRHRELSRSLREEPFLCADPQAGPPTPAPMISVLIPARNEAENIGKALEGLLSQNYPNFEVIVADDRSEDDTAAIVRRFAAEDPRVHLVEHRELPKGWTGKTHVLWQISKAARGEILFFLDADVTLDPGALPVMVNYFLETRLDAFSMLLRVQSRTFWGKATRVLLGAMLMLRFPLSKVNDPKSPRGFANGQVILMRAEAYRAVGGHESVKAMLLDDIALGQRVKEAGFRLGVAYGFDVAATWMYSSLADIWKGWSRIFYSSLVRRFPVLFYALMMLLVLSLSPYLALMFSGVCLLTGAADTATLVLFLLSIAEIAAMLSVLFRLHRTSRCESAYVAFNFLAALIALGILITAIALRFSSKGIIWKGTRYETRPETQKTS